MQSCFGAVYLLLSRGHFAGRSSSCGVQFCQSFQILLRLIEIEFVARELGSRGLTLLQGPVVRNRVERRLRRFHAGFGRRQTRPRLHIIERD